MYKFRDLPLHKRRIYPTLTSYSVLPFLQLPIPKSVHVWPQLGIEVSTRFLHRLEQACEFLLLIYHCFIKKIDLRPQTSLICKKEEKHHVRSGCKEVFSKKALLKISQNSQRNTCTGVSF